jgi:hypothetical protein
MGSFKVHSTVLYNNTIEENRCDYFERVIEVHSCSIDGPPLSALYLLKYRSKCLGIGDTGLILSNQIIQRCKNFHNSNY